MVTHAKRPDGVVKHIVDQLRRDFRSPEDVLADLPRFAEWDHESLSWLNGQLRQAHREGLLTGYELGRLSLGIERWRLHANSEDEPTEILDERTADAAALYAASRAKLDPAPRELSEGIVLRDRYVLGEAIARGGQSTIFRAHDLRRDAPGSDAARVAIKVLRDEYSHDAAIARLRREFRQSVAVQHPGVVRMYDLDRDGGSWFIVMELLEGMSLRARMNRTASHPIELSEAVRIAGGCAAVLATAHARGIPHGDIKPSNLFLQDNGGIKVLDFGAAGELRPRAAGSPGDAEVIPAAATRVYASAEVLEGEPAEPRDDVFSLACVVYEMLAGRHPFDRVPANEARPRALEAAPLPALSAAGNAALARGLAWSREDRPADVEAWVRSLAEFEASDETAILDMRSSYVADGGEAAEAAAIAASTRADDAAPALAPAAAPPLPEPPAADAPGMEESGTSIPAAATFATAAAAAAATADPATPPPAQPSTTAESGLEPERPPTATATTTPATAPIEPVGHPSTSTSRSSHGSARRPRSGAWAAVAALLLLVLGGWYLSTRDGDRPSERARDAGATPAVADGTLASTPGPVPGLVPDPGTDPGRQASAEPLPTSPPSGAPRATTAGAAVARASDPNSVPPTAPATAATARDLRTEPPESAAPSVEGAGPEPAHADTARATPPPSPPPAVVPAPGPPLGRPQVAATSGSIRVVEGAPAAAVVLRRVGGGSQAATIAWQAIDGSAHAGADFTAASGTAHFLAGQTTRAIYVPLVNDVEVEPDEYFTLLLMPSNIADIDGQGRVMVTVLDNDD